MNAGAETAGMRDYIGFGLRIRSAIDLPGAIDADAGDAELTIDTGAVAAVAMPDGEPPYALTDNGFVFAPPGVARYRFLASAVRVIVDPLPGADPEMVGALLIATTLPAIIWARGGFMLHAAAAIPPGGTHAVAIAGPSGSGKSTLLARLVTAGWTVVGEDSLALTCEGDDVIAAGLPSVLWRCDGPDRENRTAVPIPPAQQAARAPLAAILHLDAGLTGDNATINPLALPQAIATILANRHRPRLAQLMQLEAAALPVVATFCRRLEMHRLTSGDPSRIALQHLAALASPTA